MSRPPGAPNAYAALRRGTAFVRSGAARGGPATFPKVAGNNLAELARLFHILIGEAARDRRIPLPARSRDDGLRLSALCGAHAHADRLRALGRSTACLRRHGGLAHYADRRGCGRMTVGWPGAVPGATALHQVRLGLDITPSADQLIATCDFYERLASRAIGERRDARPSAPPHGLARLAA